jgi:hypothetical protein
VRRLFVLLTLCAALSATTVVPMSVERLTRASTDVVVAEAEDSWPEWNADQTLISTITRFRVQSAWKGNAAAEQTVLVRRMGGRMGNIEQKVAGVRSWRSGERAVLFLRPSRERDGAYAVTGLMQGDFRVQKVGAVLVVDNGVRGVEAFEPASGKLESYGGRRMTLSQLEAEVKRAAQR